MHPGPPFTNRLSLNGCRAAHASITCSPVCPAGDPCHTCAWRVGVCVSHTDRVQQDLPINASKASTAVTSLPELLVPCIFARQVHIKKMFSPLAAVPVASTPASPCLSCTLLRWHHTPTVAEGEGGLACPPNLLGPEPQKERNTSYTVKECQCECAKSKKQACDLDATTMHTEQTHQAAITHLISTALPHEAVHHPSFHSSLHRHHHTHIESLITQAPAIYVPNPLLDSILFNLPVQFLSLSLYLLLLYLILWDGREGG